MSLHEYQKSREIASHEYPFYALIMAAIRQADTDNLTILQAVFPETYVEFWKRYNAPGGVLIEED